MDDDLENAFGDLFGDFFGGTRAGPTRGRDLRVDLELDLADIDSGCVREIEVRRGKLCRTCTGTGYEPATSVTPCVPCKGKGRLSRASGAFVTDTQCSACLGRGRAYGEPDRNVPARLGDDRDIAVPSGVQLEHPATRRLDREHDRDP